MFEPFTLLQVAIFLQNKKLTTVTVKKKKKEKKKKLPTKPAYLFRS